MIGKFILLLMFVPSLSVKAQSVSANSIPLLAADDRAGSYYVDPLIGSEGLGRVFIGPSCPFGMVKPGPDCGVSNNAGWAPMPAELSGFSQTHVSGTGGGPKYGNVLVKFAGKRASEDVRLGYYSCTMTDGRKAEITTAERASFYRFTGVDKVEIDLQHFLGRNPVPKAREAQQYEGSMLTVLNDSVTTGYQTISGGWNNGGPYTVYFYAKKETLSPTPEGQGEKGCLLKIGISFVSIEQARLNMEEDIPHWNFNRTYEECVQKWERELSKVKLDDAAPLNDKKMFYTALYHTMLMPVDRSNDQDVNGKYYDDYYAIWDTYRTNTPLLTILNPERATEIAQSLLNIYRLTGYMPDARSGNSNGRTQGGSNAEIVMADALAKGLDLDYELALEAMLKDATVPPCDDEAEGRGGLAEYNELGYIPFGIARGGNRTVEYSFCDWAIAQVAKGLNAKNKKMRTGKGKPKTFSSSSLDQIYQEYMRKAGSWKNLWRSDYVHDGAKGFIMPRDADGEWLDSVPFGHSELQPQKFRYTPDISYEGPWYCPWWSCYFYEASSWEYSFSIPHDIPGLIEACGGGEEFEHRLDRFFNRGYYNVANEPSFLTPCLYHWIGKPQKSGERVARIIKDNYNASVKGLPGNDDSGAMSAWLAFHMMGLYPNAGHDYYLVHAPMVDGVSIRLDSGKELKIRKVLSTDDRVELNGKELKDWRITHSQMLEGGELLVKTSTRKHRMKYSLHGQTRRFDVDFVENQDSLTMNWSIERNFKMWHGAYSMTPEARRSAKAFSYEQPLDGNYITLPHQHMFAVLSRDALESAKNKGWCMWGNTKFEVVDEADDYSSAISRNHGVRLIHLRDVQEGSEMWVEDDSRLPVVWKMINNPVEINWEVES